MIEITEQPIDAQTVLSGLGDEHCGAVVLFLGTTRQFTGEKETVELNYDCYREMAIKKLAELRKQAMDRWPIQHCRLIHRVGVVPAGQASVAVGVAGPRRTEAFDAAKWLIDTIKEVVPIWKQEVWSDGTKSWVHPGAPGSP